MHVIIHNTQILKSFANIFTQFLCHGLAGSRGGPLPTGYVTNVDEHKVAFL